MVRVLTFWLWLGVAASAVAQEKLKVVTTFLPAYSFAASVAGTHAEVENLLPGGASLHEVQLAPSDIRKIAAADLVLVNGLGLETFLDRVFANSAPGTREKIVTLSAGLPKEVMEEADHDHDHGDEEHTHHHHDVDPHIWLDPQLAMHCVTNVLTALKRADPRNAVHYERNAAEYLAGLNKLDAEIAASLAPVTNVAFITYHDAFRYMARRYGLNIAAVVKKNPEVTPSARELGELYRTIRGQKVKALFTEPGDRSRLARRIAADTRIRLGELDPLETGRLSATAYEEGMRRNAENLRQTLRP